VAEPVRLGVQILKRGQSGFFMVAPPVTKTGSSPKVKKFQAAELEQEGQRRPDLRLTKDY